MNKIFAASLALSLVGSLSIVRIAETSQSTPTQRTVALPAPTNVSKQSSFRCRSLLATDLTSSYDSTLTNGLKGTLADSTNSVSISIENPKKLAFLSGAGFDLGVARGPEFDIVANTARELVATYFDGSSMNSFVLNKTVGLAVWSKIRPDFPGYGAPTGSQDFLTCR
jgi:hypothetical protein